jgi:hypothetical protein
MNDEQSQVIYRLLNSAHKWHGKACKLKHCADLLFKTYLAARGLSPEEQSETQDSEIDDVATLLYGMAMEDVLKAALLKEGIAQMRADGTVAWSAEGARDHDLLGICRSLKSVSLNADQEKLLERLSAFVCWAGKYPTPLNRKRNKDFQGFHLSNQPRAAAVTLPLPFDGEDKNMFDQIYETISERIHPFKKTSA